MTDRLYYTDSYSTHFTARVVERVDLDGRPAILLDHTLFYPTGGGQPCDLGAINGIPVVEVLSRDDGEVVHVLAADLPDPDSPPATGHQPSAIRAEIDWLRRFDLMQQHTGQHILSQAFLRAAGAKTVSFHLNAETADIEVEAKGLAPAALAQAEDLANEIVTSDAVVRAWFPTADELNALTLRGVPEVDGPLRVVAIGDFDATACGGTHVARAGEVGMVKILRVEKAGPAMRVEFRCGRRALLDYRQKNAALLELASSLSVGHVEVSEVVARLQTEAKTLRRDLKTARESLLDFEAAELLARTEAVNGRRVIRSVWDGRDGGELRALATKLTAGPGVVALLAALTGPQAALVFARSVDVEANMAALLKQTLASLEGGRGGGSPLMAQGGGAGSLASVSQALEQAEAALSAK